MYLVFLTYLTGDTTQTSFVSPDAAFEYMAKNVDYVAALEIKRVR